TPTVVSDDRPLFGAVPRSARRVQHPMWRIGSQTPPSRMMIPCTVAAGAEPAGVDCTAPAACAGAGAATASISAANTAAVGKASRARDRRKLRLGDEPPDWSRWLWAAWAWSVLLNIRNPPWAFFRCPLEREPARPSSGCQPGGMFLLWWKALSGSY